MIKFYCANNPICESVINIPDSHGKDIWGMVTGFYCKECYDNKKQPESKSSCTLINAKEKYRIYTPSDKLPSPLKVYDDYDGDRYLVLNTWMSIILCVRLKDLKYEEIILTSIDNRIMAEKYNLMEKGIYNSCKLIKLSDDQPLRLIEELRKELNNSCIHEFDNNILLSMPPKRQCKKCNQLITTGE